MMCPSDSIAPSAFVSTTTTLSVEEDLRQKLAAALGDNADLAERISDVGLVSEERERQLRELEAATDGGMEDIVELLFPLATDERRLRLTVDEMPAAERWELLVKGVREELNSNERTMRSYETAHREGVDALIGLLWNGEKPDLNDDTYDNMEPADHFRVLADRVKELQAENAQLRAERDGSHAQAVEVALEAIRVKHAASRAPLSADELAELRGLTNVEAAIALGAACEAQNARSCALIHGLSDRFKKTAENELVLNQQLQVAEKLLLNSVLRQPIEDLLEFFKTAPYSHIFRNNGIALRIEEALKRADDPNHVVHLKG
jgi:hypothetical protein